MMAGPGPVPARHPEPAPPPQRTGDVTTHRARGSDHESGATTDDRHLVDAVLGGDLDAFRRIVERESSSVVSTCARVLGDRSEAEDVAQETFVIAYRSLGTWRAEGPLGAWISRIAVRLAVRRASQRRQVVWLDPLAADADLPNRDRFRTSGVTDATDPSHSVVSKERDTMLRDAVAALEEPYREVVALRFFAERSLAEIAETVDRPLGTVKTQLHRGLARLRRVLDETDR